MKIGQGYERIANIANVEQNNHVYILDLVMLIL